MTKTAYVDIETMYPWQEKMLTGIKAGEMTIISAARQTGKSLYSDMFNAVFQWAPTYEQLESAELDGEQWTSVRCDSDIAKWVRGQNTKYWYEHKGGVRAVFDLHEKLYTMLRLKFTP
jgi:hypothetical protein